MPLLLALLFCFVYVVMDNVATSPASSGYTQSAGLKASVADATAQTLRAYHATAVAWLEQPAQASFVGTVPRAVVEQALALQSIQPGNYTTFRAADGLTTTWLAVGASERVKNARVGDIATALVRADGEARTAGTVRAGSFRPGNGSGAIALDPQIAATIRDGMPMLTSVINMPQPNTDPGVEVDLVIDGCAAGQFGFIGKTAVNRLNKDGTSTPIVAPTTVDGCQNPVTTVEYTRRPCTSGINPQGVEIWRRDKTSAANGVAYGEWVLAGSSCGPGAPACTPNVDQGCTGPTVEGQMLQKNGSYPECRVTDCSAPWTGKWLWFRQVYWAEAKYNGSKIGKSYRYSPWSSLGHECKHCYPVVQEDGSEITHCDYDNVGTVASNNCSYFPPPQPEICPASVAEALSQYATGTSAGPAGGTGNVRLQNEFGATSGGTYYLPIAAGFGNASWVRPQMTTATDMGYGFTAGPNDTVIRNGTVASGPTYVDGLPYKPAITIINGMNFFTDLILRNGSSGGQTDPGYDLAHAGSVVPYGPLPYSGGSTSAEILEGYYYDTTTCLWAMRITHIADCPSCGVQ